MSSPKKLICKRTSRQVFMRVYRLEIQSFMLAFLIQLCELLPLWPSLLFFSPSPLPCVNKYTVYTYSIQCVCVGGGILGLRKINTCHKVPLQVNYFRWHILHCLLWVLYFYWWAPLILYQLDTWPMPSPDKFSAGWVAMGWKLYRIDCTACPARSC